MPQSWSRVLLSLLAAPLLFASCKKDYSKDNPITPVYSPSIIIGSDNQVLYAFNPTDGSKNWELSLPCPIMASPMLYGNFVYVANSRADTLYKINAKTGEIVKRISYTGSSAGATATPVADGNLIYLASANGTLYVIDTSQNTTKWYFATGASLVASPVVYNGNVYLANTAGSVFCLEKTNGTTAPLPASPAPTWSLAIPSARFTSSPTIGGTSPSTFMYIGSESDSNMYSLWLDLPSTTTTGVIRWTYKTKGAIKSSPAFYGGNCIFGCSDFRLYCIDTTLDPLNPGAPPEARWIDSNIHSEIISSPFAVDQTVYVGSKDYKLYAVKMLNGQHRWEFASTGVITSSPIVYKGTVYVGSYDKNLYAVDTAKGTLKWRMNVNGQIECSPVIDDFSQLKGYNSQISGFQN